MPTLLACRVSAEKSADSLIPISKLYLDLNRANSPPSWIWSRVGAVELRGLYPGIV